MSPAMMVLKGVKDFGPQVAVVLAAGWMALLILIDLGAFATNGGNEASPAREESSDAGQLETGCVEIDGIRICE